MSKVGDLQHEYKFSLIQQFTHPESDKTVKHSVSEVDLVRFLCDFEHENTATQGNNIGGRR